MDKNNQRQLSVRRRRTVSAITALGLCGLLLMPKPAKADHPIVVALITAGGVVAAAAIGAVGVVTAAVITTYGGGGGGGGGDGGGGGGDTIVPGTDEDGNIMESRSGSSTPIVNGGATITGTIDRPRQKAKLGALDLDPKARSFMDRSVSMALAKVRKKGLGARVAYAFEGDVMKADQNVASFTGGDVIEWQFEVQGPGALPIAIEDLTLSTTDVPGTFGYSSMVITATQDGKTIATWKARVEQGKAPAFDRPPNEGAKVKASPGALQIDRVLLMLPVKYGVDNKAKVVVTMVYEGSGQRLSPTKPIK